MRIYTARTIFNEFLKIVGWAYAFLLVTIIAVGYAACSPQTKTYRFRLIVSDAENRELGHGVWEAARWRSYPNVSFALAGAAFPIKLPSGQRAFVLRREASWVDWRKSAWANGNIVREIYADSPELQRAIRRLPDGRADGKRLSVSEEPLNLYSEMGKLKSRFPLPPGLAPVVVTFDDEADPRSVRLVTETLRFHFQATHARLSPGVEKILPWLVDQNPRDKEKKLRSLTALDGQHRDGHLVVLDRDWRSVTPAQRILYSDFWLGGWSTYGGFSRW